MIIVAGQIRIDPAQREQAIAHAVKMMEATRKEDGCHSYTFYGDLTDPGLFFVFEEWASLEHLAAHFETEHMAQWRKNMANITQEGNVYRYTVTDSAKL